MTLWEAEDHELHGHCQVRLGQGWCSMNTAKPDNPPTSSPTQPWKSSFPLRKEALWAHKAAAQLRRVQAHTRHSSEPDLPLQSSKPAGSKAGTQACSKPSAICPAGPPCVPSAAHPEHQRRKLNHPKLRAPDLRWSQSQLFCFRSHSSFWLFLSDFSCSSSSSPSKSQKANL